MKLILASGSPRRREMFEAHGYAFAIRPSAVDERVPEGLTPAETVLYLSWIKTRAVEEEILAERAPSNADPAQAAAEPSVGAESPDGAEPERVFLVGADTIVYLPANAADPVDVPAVHGPVNGTYRGAILGKPKDAEDAALMLRDLADTANYVLTGVTVIEAGTPNRRSFVSVSRVDMAPYGDDYVRDYVASGEPMDKAGGYALQGRQACKILRVEGSETNVIGLPWDETEQTLTEMGYRKEPF
jgi:septum formation protein